MIIEFKKEHAIDIMQRNEKELGRIVPKELANTMLQAYGIPGSRAFTMVKDDIPIACGGIMNMEWRRGEAWMIFSKLHSKYKFEVYKEIGKHLVTVAKELNLRRVQAICLRDDMDNWFKRLGFEREAPLRKYGPNGEDVIMYSRIFGDT